MGGARRKEATAKAGEQDAALTQYKRESGCRGLPGLMRVKMGLGETPNKAVR